MSSGTGSACSLAPVQVLPFAIAARPSCRCSRGGAVFKTSSFPFPCFICTVWLRQKRSQSDRQVYRRFPQELGMTRERLRTHGIWCRLGSLAPQPAKANCRSKGRRGKIPYFLGSAGTSCTIMRV